MPDCARIQKWRACYCKLEMALRTGARGPSTVFRGVNNDEPRGILLHSKNASRWTVSVKWGRWTRVPQA